MLIYLIQNKINQKCYIGQTIHNTFNKRYSGGRWWDISDNQKLKAAYNKYGKDNFEITILEKGVSNIKELNRLEEFYAEKYNAYHPNGYNLVKCGDNRKLLPHQIEDIRNKKSKTYILRKIDTWELIEIFNLSKFCNDNNLKNSGMYNMIKKRDNVLVFNNFCLPETTKEQIRDKNKRKFKGIIFKLVDSDGNLYEINDINEFIKKFNLEEGSFRKLLNKQMLYYKGFRLQERQFEKKPRDSYYSFISPSGEICSGFGLSRFAKSKNLNPTGLYSLISQRRKTYKGWRIYNESS